MDGEVAQLAALVISANNRIAHSDDPMPWFAGQRAFDRCGSIAFHTSHKRRYGKDRRVPVAETPGDWLDRLTESGVERVVMSCIRQDQDDDEDMIPDRLSAGFAGGGSLWSMTSETPDGGVIRWTPGWRAAYPRDPDGRIWAVEYLANPSPATPPGVDLEEVRNTLRAALSDMNEFAQAQHFDQVAAIFGSALCLLDGAPDPRPVPRPPGPADTLPPPARRLLFAAQRGWTFDNMSLWRDQDFSQDVWVRYAALSEQLYTAVTTAMVAAVNASVPV
ncbi:hypothetical protein [Aliiroseovarius subalbicans]|uniref:hypothetical protein n=1 Tax=Aliiroseovarius subalbicans TaxID=2925840 RepID=UPI001F5706D3|nr:hypothetical protein [Aliiroseovarius subalbicans]MCI2399760.1 hypothetical protein [Aliiroseovarius subalbicans]